MPDKFPLDDLILDDEEGWALNLETAFMTAEEELGIAKLLDGEDIALEPDQKSIYTYVMEIYKTLKDRKPVVPLKPYTRKDEKKPKENKFEAQKRKMAETDEDIDATVRFVAASSRLR